MSDYPQSKSDLELGHHIIHYTFIPVLVIGFGAVLSSPVLWYTSTLELEVALAIPWLSILGMCLYLSLFGNYVIPRETYRNLRSGEWDD